MDNQIEETEIKTNLENTPNHEEIKNYLYQKYKYNHKWFLESELFYNIHKYIDKNARLFILEIGSYEGLSAVFFSDYYLDHKNSILVCVDPFDTHDVSTPVEMTTEQLFIDNVNKSNNSCKVFFIKNYSNDFFNNNYQLFDFIYVDGSHEPHQMYLDMINAYNACKVNGIIWLDDYRGGDHSNGPNYAMKEAVDVFLQDYNKQIKIIHDNYQLGIQKLC
jgi:predicted O-methyltransferase YrrM